MRPTTMHHLAPVLSTHLLSYSEFEYGVARPFMTTHLVDLSTPDGHLHTRRRRTQGSCSVAAQRLGDTCSFSLDSQPGRLPERWMLDRRTSGASQHSKKVPDVRKVIHAATERALSRKKARVAAPRQAPGDVPVRHGFGVACLFSHVSAKAGWWKPIGRHLGVFPTLAARPLQQHPL